MRPDDLSFLQPANPAGFVIRGNNPFYAPYQAPFVARPIKPPPRPVTPPPTITSPAKAPTFKNIEIVYKGMMIAGDGKALAMVQDRISGSSLFLNIGDTVQGGSVRAFNPNRLVWEKAGERIELKLGQSYTVGQIQIP